MPLFSDFVPIIPFFLNYLTQLSPIAQFPNAIVPDCLFIPPFDIILFRNCPNCLFIPSVVCNCSQLLLLALFLALICPAFIPTHPIYPLIFPTLTLIYPTLIQYLSNFHLNLSVIILNCPNLPLSVLLLRIPSYLFTNCGV